ncbi:hypothetical protein BT63DRAFT_456209 [Microthyrium microscopicum]|uniref:LysM domain-containing protein n=1 Tax=Microthyrium microscopicum TaxID=703497 RepID=A0A6A6U8G5_9PEZI|nr:hypothetical protein BT63DRAFT_456209 [Microthyrium microscopicum]
MLSLILSFALGVQALVVEVQSSADGCSRKWHINEGSVISCQTLQNSFSISKEDFYSWNPSAEQDCKLPQLPVGREYCIASKDQITGPKPPAKASPTPSPPAASNTPTKQPPAASPPPDASSSKYKPGCSKFYDVVEGDTCWKIANEKLSPKSSVDEIRNLNPFLNNYCSIQPGIKLCIATGGPIPPSQPTQAPAPAPPGNSLPSPIWSGSLPPSKCKEYRQVRHREDCSLIEADFGLNHIVFQILNPGIDSGCANVMAGFYVCVALKPDVRR